MPRRTFVGKVPADVVGILVDDNVVATPPPVVAVIEVKGSDTEVETAKPETAGSVSDNAPHVASTEAPLKVAMLPWMVNVETGFVASIVVANPFAVAVDVRGLGVVFAIAERMLVFVVMGIAVISGGPCRRK